MIDKNGEPAVNCNAKPLRTRSLTVEQLELRRLLAINPTSQEQEELQLINRFRTDPLGEFNRVFLSSTPLVARDSSLQEDLDFFKVNGEVLKSEWAAISPVAPLTWNEVISNFSASHNQSMITQNQLFHTDPLKRREDLQKAGANLAVTPGQSTTAEIVFGSIKSAIHNYAGYAVNWAVGTNGMRLNRPHRSALVNGDFDEIGGKVTNTTASSMKPQVNTFVLANIKDAAVRVSGAVFQDKNSNGWYEAGEGLGAVKLSFESTTGQFFSTNAFNTGGYQVDLPAGAYKVRVSGGAMQHALVRTLTVADKSLWVNFNYSADGPVPDAQEPNDTSLFAGKLTAPNATLTSLSLHAATDIDVFKYVPVGTGIATYELHFSNAAGNIDLQLLDKDGEVLASSKTTGDVESIQFQADANTDYYLRVSGAANSNYSLKVSGPEAISADANEPNDQLTSATLLAGVSPVLTGMSLHSNKDNDYFKYVSTANGQGKFEIQFNHTQGNIDLQLLDQHGAVLATSAGTGDGESIAQSLARDQTYFLKVFGGPNRTYNLSVSGPTLKAPLALRDQATITSDNRSKKIAILNNDSDSDGNKADLIPSFAATPPGSFSLNADKTIQVDAPVGFSGLLRASYLVEDPDGLRSPAAFIDVIVIDYSREWPWQNTRKFTDSNSDGNITPTDALLVINFLNDGGSRLLPKAGNSNIFGFLDVKPNGIVTATDALLIINELNDRASSEAEAEGLSQSRVALTNHDLALAQLMSAGIFSEEDRQRKRR
jgi:uncharacterized protein YkwD